MIKSYRYISSFQVKDKPKRKQPTKAIRLDAEGDASLEDLTNVEAQVPGQEPSPDLEKASSSNKKVRRFSIFKLVP